MEVYIHRETCTKIFLATLSARSKAWEQLKCHSTWAKYEQTVVLEVRKNELLTHATIWVNFKIIMQFECSQMTKSTYCIIPFIYNFRKSKLCILIAGRLLVAWKWEGGKERLERRIPKRHQDTFRVLGLCIVCILEVCYWYIPVSQLIEQYTLNIQNVLL